MIRIIQLLSGALVIGEHVDHYESVNILVLRNVMRFIETETETKYGWSMEPYSLFNGEQMRFFPSGIESVSDPSDETINYYFKCWEYHSFNKKRDETIIAKATSEMSYLIAQRKMNKETKKVNSQLLSLDDISKEFH